MLSSKAASLVSGERRDHRSQARRAREGRPGRSARVGMRATAHAMISWSGRFRAAGLPVRSRVVGGAAEHGRCRAGADLASVSGIAGNRTVLGGSATRGVGRRGGDRGRASPLPSVGTWSSTAREFLRRWRSGHRRRRPMVPRLVRTTRIMRQQIQPTGDDRW